MRISVIFGRVEMNFRYPRSPLAETYKSFLERYLASGGGQTDFRGRNPRNPWEMMLVKVDEWAGPPPESLATMADGGIASLPETMDWHDHSRARVAIGAGPFMTYDELDILMWKKERRAGTLAETLLLIATTPRGLLANRTLLCVTEEKLHVEGKRANGYFQYTSRGEIYGSLTPRKTKVEPSFLIPVVKIR